MQRPGAHGFGNGSGPTLRGVRRFGASALACSALTSGGALALAQNAPQSEPPKAGTPSGQIDAKGAGVEVKEAPAAIDDGPSYLVSRFLLEYARANAATDVPDLQDPKFQTLSVTLGKTPEGYVGLRPGVEKVTIRLSEITEGSGGKFFKSAIEDVCRAVVDEFNRRGVYALFVAPSAEDIEERAPYKDKRDGRTALRLSVYTGVVKEVRTAASGDRQLPGEKINNPAHARILDRSPVKPGDLLRKDDLDDYLYRLNRHPGRRVDAAIASQDAADPGAIQVDYLVGENKPWTAYFQLSNTGTENTDVWRERFGFVHNQLTNHDYILRLDYSTAGFDASNAVLGSYEFPIYTDTVRGRVYGNLSQFTASDVGQNADTFTGNSWTAGFELIGTIYQRGPFFLDLVGGARFDHYRVVSPLSGTDTDVVGNQTFFLPYLALRAERRTDAASTLAEVGVDWTIDGVTDVDPAEVEKLGRVPVDSSWVIMKWNLEQSLYLEPLINGPRGTPDGKGMTLAHELWGSFRGQYSFGNRFIPNVEAVAGGLYTVRGYPESAVAGDNAYIGTLEYRFHFPNSQATREPGKFMGHDFLWAPQSPYGRADWDLIFKGFIDAANVTNSDRQDYESDATLVGAGIGGELQMSRYLNLRLDWGFPLRSLHTQDRDVTAGKSQVHFVATVSF